MAASTDVLGPGRSAPAGCDPSRHEPAAPMRLRLLADSEVATLRADVLGQLNAVVEGGADAVTAALRTAPGGWTMAARAGEDVLFGEGTVLIAGGLAGRILPAEAGAEARPAEAADAEAFCRLADALPQVAAVEPLPVVTSGGGSPAISRPLGVATAFAATGKHIVAVAFTAAEAHAVIEMAKLVAGGDAELRARPLVTLAAPPAALDVATTAAQAGVPCLIAISVGQSTAAEGAGADAAGSAGTEATTDAPNALVSRLADGLAAAAKVLERVPGAAIGLALPPYARPPLDDRHLVIVAALADLSHSFGLPLLATALATQAAGPGWLASAENTAASLACHLAGVDGLAGAGLLSGGATVSLIELALDTEIVSYAAATHAGVPVDDETLAVETIEKVGIAGNYLGARHTRRHRRGGWRPRFFDRTPYEQWLREGRLQSVELAGDHVRKTLAQHSAPPLAAALAEQVTKIALQVGKETQ